MILMAMACLGWIGAISLAVLFFLGTSISSAWIFGGALVFAVVIWLAVMIREIREAIELPDAFARRGGREFTAKECRKSTRRGAPPRVPTNTI